MLGLNTRMNVRLYAVAEVVGITVTVRVNDMKVRTEVVGMNVHVHDMMNVRVNALSEVSGWHEC